MAELTLSEAASRFGETLKGDDRQSKLAEVGKFVRWYGAGKTLGELRGHDISLYAEGMGPATPDTSRRADHVREFLAFLKKEGLVEGSLAPHLRLRKNTAKAGPAVSDAPAVELTRDGVKALEAELESLMQQRVDVRAEIRRAMLDKDFRENAPLDAAKDKQGHIEARIREIESMLKRAVIVEAAAAGGRVRVGTTVVLTNTGNGRRLEYAIVGPTEANAAGGKISSASPVGKALLDRAPGDEVEISVPAGVMRLRVEEVRG